MVEKMEGPTPRGPRDAQGAQRVGGSASHINMIHRLMKGMNRLLMVAVIGQSMGPPGEGTAAANFRNRLLFNNHLSCFQLFSRLLLSFYRPKSSV